AKSLRIDFVSDVACPWCAIGLGGLTKALRTLDGEVEAQLYFQPFELRPDMPPGGVNRTQMLRDKYGMSAEQALASRDMIRDRAAEVGFTMNADDNARSYNTFGAHRLLHWAETQGRQALLKQALLEAYFTTNRNVEEPDVLAEAAAQAGLDRDAAREVVTSGRYSQEVREAEDIWRQRGISSVPAIVINETYLISGGQPAQVFEQALRKIAAEVG
ncbi:MAG: DsbA family oxidoreductase, partial [Alphaproteobacteria bacterium]